MRNIYNKGSGTSGSHAKYDTFDECNWLSGSQKNLRRDSFKVDGIATSHDFFVILHAI